MRNKKEIVERLSLFNNLSFTKKQWEIILSGCNCPKSSHFWTALRWKNLINIDGKYTLLDINESSFEEVWNHYCTMNRAAVNKYNKKVKARKRVEKIKGITLFMVDGVLTTELPIRD